MFPFLLVRLFALLLTLLTARRLSWLLTSSTLG